MKKKSLIDLAESLIDLTNQEAENISAIKLVADMAGPKDKIFIEALKESIDLLIDAHEYRTRLAYVARNAAYSNDDQTVKVCVNAIQENIDHCQIIRQKMSELISKTIGAKNG